MHPDVPPPDLLDARPVWLRRARLDDAADLFAAYASDPTATRYLSWSPRTNVGEVEAWLAPRIAGWDHGHEYRWVIADGPDRPAFGTVSLRRTDTGFDLGYALATERSGAGIATAAVARVLRWLDAATVSSATDAASVRACTDPDNAASVRVLHRTGFRQVGHEAASWRRPSLGDELRDTLVFERRPQGPRLSGSPGASPDRG